MLGFLTGKWRVRAASLLVVLYAFCLVAPTAVLALSTNMTAVHCLTESLPAGGSNHVHENDSHRNHSPSSDDHDQTSKCCGLFLVNGVVPASDFVTARAPLVSQLSSTFEASLSGQDSDRIDRPPRSLLSL